ncbi:hypothetical protein J4405_06015 [Candidatus Woesearchaeota archaeon]|nr:hypothetical protein [Candidatus Woesearchaeota archaeon]
MGRNSHVYLRKYNYIRNTDIDFFDRAVQSFPSFVYPSSVTLTLRRDFDNVPLRGARLEIEYHSEIRNGITITPNLKSMRRILGSSRENTVMINIIDGMADFDNDFKRLLEYAHELGYHIYSGNIRLSETSGILNEGSRYEQAGWKADSEVVMLRNLPRTQSGLTLHLEPDDKYIEREDKKRLEEWFTRLRRYS